MQINGNLVLSDAYGNAHWSTNKYPYPGAYLILQLGGNMVVYAPGTNSVLGPSAPQVLYASSSLNLPCA